MPERYFRLHSVFLNHRDPVRHRNIDNGIAVGILSCRNPDKSVSCRNAALGKFKLSEVRIYADGVAAVSGLYSEDIFGDE